MYYDVIVCGAGIQGLWTCYYLLLQKKKVLLLEQFPLLHSRGSSHGGSRITRYTYDTKHHAKMMPEAFQKWEALEEKNKQELFINTGLLSIGTESVLAERSAALNFISIPSKNVKASEIQAKFPGLRSHACDGVFEGTAGVLKAQQCLQALIAAITSMGGEIRDCEKVEEVQVVSSDLVRVRTSKDVHSSAAIVLTCGPWMNELLKTLNLQLPLRPEKIQVNYWTAKDPKLYDARRKFPCTIIRDETHVEAYSTPILEYPGLMKVCCHFGVDIDPDARDVANNEELKKQHIRALTQLIKTYFPNLHPEVAVQESCIYTMTPDKDFILDRHPAHKNVIIGAGFSGHGFKLSPVVGRILGDLALKNEPAYPLHHFAISRFNHKAKL